MKKIEKLKLTKLSKNALDNRPMGMLKGGYDSNGSNGCEGCDCNCNTTDPAHETSSAIWRVA